MTGNGTLGEAYFGRLMHEKLLSRGLYFSSLGILTVQCANLWVPHFLSWFSQLTIANFPFSRFCQSQDAQGPKPLQEDRNYRDALGEGTRSLRRLQAEHSYYRCQ